MSPVRCTSSNASPSSWWGPALVLQNRSHVPRKVPARHDIVSLDVLHLHLHGKRAVLALCAIGLPLGVSAGMWKRLPDSSRSSRAAAIAGSLWGRTRHPRAQSDPRGTCPQTPRCTGVSRCVNRMTHAPVECGQSSSAQSPMAVVRLERSGSGMCAQFFAPLVIVSPFRLWQRPRWRSVCATARPTASHGPRRRPSARAQTAPPTRTRSGRRRRQGDQHNGVDDVRDDHWQHPHARRDPGTARCAPRRAERPPEED